MNHFGTIARVRTPQLIGLLTEMGTPSVPFQSIQLTPETPFFVEGEGGRTLYIRLLSGRHEQRLAALASQDVEVLQDRPDDLLVA